MTQKNWKIAKLTFQALETSTSLSFYGCDLTLPTSLIPKFVVFERMKCSSLYFQCEHRNCKSTEIKRVRNSSDEGCTQERTNQNGQFGDESTTKGDWVLLVSINIDFLPHQSVLALAHRLWEEEKIIARPSVGTPDLLTPTPCSISASHEISVVPTGCLI